MVRLAVLVSLLAAGWGCSLGGARPLEKAVTVYVTDASTSEPLEGGTVTLEDRPARGIDRTGRVVWTNLPAGEYRVRADAPGWIARDTAVQVGSGETRLDLDLQPEADREVEGLEALDVLRDPTSAVVLQRRGFYRRRDDRAGVFLTRRDLDDRGITRFEDVFGIVSGVQVDETDGISRVVSSRRRGCPLSLFLDGVESRRGRADAVAIGNVAGVEVYRGVTEVPSEFYRNSGAGDCGVVLVWTRSDTR